MVQKTGAALQHVVPGGIEIIRIPGIGNAAWMVCIVQQHGDLLFRVGSVNPKHVSDIVGVHAYDIVKFLIVAPGRLSGPFALAGDAVLLKLGPGRRINRIPHSPPYLLRAGGRGLDIKGILQMGFFHQILHDKLGHGAPADIAVTYEQNSYQINSPLRIAGFRHVFAVSAPFSEST